ncbi:glycosyl transferase family 8 [Phlyctema vagabunda]|uniref:Glycosyl transferase family 8 n=1 Tax=Phlyctema vagabunda TaxID=108571 RepID=A0ABR4PXL0_9HELO
MAPPEDGEDVYATLLLNDSYLPGALVLAHSLRDAGTTKKLAVLITADSISTECIAELDKLYDFVIPVERIVNETPANLFLMGRGDLHSTFTKINLWKLVQFRKVVYLDADMVALRAPDELFNLPQPFSAAPDIGWPDLFNSGLMVLNPNMGDYYALLAMAQRGISFDGADQGLLNMHFKNSYNRLSFTYNVTPSAHYQYLPAYRHFQSGISMAHFIGQNKPWTAGREASKGATPYDEMAGRWWAVYDRHFRESSVDSSSTGISPLVQYHTKGEYQPPSFVITSPAAETDSEIFHPVHEKQNEQPTVEGASPAPEVHESKEVEVTEAPVTEQYSAWDASKAPPPADARPEAANFPSTHYDMSSDPTPFKAPERYPEPPKGMYYEVPKEPPTYQKPVPIFPWEKDAAKPTRVFLEDEPKPVSEPEPAPAPKEEDEEPTVTPTTPTFRITAADPWQTFTARNAWDDIPEIERYIGNLQRNRKGNIQVLQGYGSGIEEVSSPGGQRRHSMKLTDFPTELERPSLPVTPAPIRRPSFWGEERDEAGKLPAAEGVPTQAEWVSACSLNFKRQISLLMIHRILQHNWIS